MLIELQNISKKYSNQWIFRNVTFSFEPDKRYGIRGSNGSGKSTLLKIITSKIPPTKGKIKYSIQNTDISPDDCFNHFSIATTSMELIEEFSLSELINFQFKFRKPVHSLSTKEMLSLFELEKEKNKRIGNFSSGMKQRLKIGLAILSESDYIILDEPGANLDENSKIWFKELIDQYALNRGCIIASNELSDFDLCESFLDISNFK